MAKKEKKSVVGLRPTTSYSPLRGQNQDYGGVGVKNDNADYTISDEHIHNLNQPAHAPEWERETLATRKALAAKLERDTDPNRGKKMKKSLREVAEGRTLAEIKEMLSLVNEDDMVKNLKPINLTGGSDARTNKLADKASGKEATPAPIDKKKEAAAFLNKEEVEHIEEARGRPKKDSASDSPDTHPIQQARQVISTRGMHPFTFADGKKHSMNPMTAHRILAHHDNLQTPSEKEAFASRIHKNVDSLHSWLAGKPHDEELPKISLGGSSKVGGIGGRSRPSISGMKPGKKK
jgi:DNA-binding transcriptional MerR regulator